MRPPRDIIKHVTVEVAKGGRKCHRTREHRIAIGEKCIVVQEGAFSGSKNYCVSCGLEIVVAAEARLISLRVALQGRA
jgi:hypothetical protein